MIAAIVGSTDGLPWYGLRLEVYRIAGRTDVTEIVSGGARGVDSVAADAARLSKCKLTVFPADWATHGRRAGFLRNIQIVEAADEVFAFWDGKSKGTAHTIRLAGRMGKPCHVWTPEKGWRS